MGILQKCNPFANVAANATATVSLQIGMTYKRLILALGGTSFTKSHITNIKVKANTRTIWDVSGDHLDAINKFDGIYDAAGFLTIDFSELKSKTIAGENVGALDSSMLSQLNVEVVIGGATAPTLDMWAELDPPQLQYDAVGKPVARSKEQLVCTKLLTWPLNLTAGDQIWESLPKGMTTGALIKRIHVFSTGQVVNYSELKLNGLVVHEQSKALMDFNLREYGKVPQTGMYTIDFTKSGNQADSLDTRGSEGNQVQSLVLKLNNASAIAGRVYAEVYDAIGNL